MYNVWSFIKKRFIVLSKSEQYKGKGVRDNV